MILTQPSPTPAMRRKGVDVDLGNTIQFVTFLEYVSSYIFLIASNINLLYRNTKGLFYGKTDFMRNKIRIYIIFSLFLTSLAQAQPLQNSSNPIPPNAIRNKNFKLGSFNVVEVNGPMSVSINANQPKSNLQIRSDAHTLAHMDPYVEHGVLYLTPPSYHGKNPLQQPIQVNISCPSLHMLKKTGYGNVTASNLSGPLSAYIYGYGTVSLQGQDIDLRGLKVDGPTNVTIDGVNSRLLNVQQDGPSNINLRGVAVLQCLDHYGSGSFSLYWVNSTRVKIIASGTGKISLAGTACFLDVTLYDWVCLAAKQLRVQQAFVNTNNKAQANVWVKDSLSTLARGASNIYYYKDPAFLGRYTNPPASTLRMSCLPRCQFNQE